jgi:dipeptidyl aminopeptidase/acylaminoacyl peptidase
MFRRVALAAIACAVVCAAQKLPVTHEAIWLMKRVGAPVPSPDGRWVVFSVVEPAYDEREQVTDLWIVPTDGSSKPRRLTATKGPESDPAWSPDSRRIAFSARREGDEANQIYVLDLAGGDAVRITDLVMGASAPRWSPDGKLLAFTSLVWPGATDEESNRRIVAERKARKARARIYETFPIRHWDRWIEDARPHLFVVEAQPGARPRDLLAGTKLASETGFRGRREAEGGESLDAVWAPDGQSLVFVATTQAHTAAYSFVPTHLYQVGLNGGEPRALTSGRDSFRRPVFSPDGRSLYCLYERHTGKIYNLTRLARFDWPSVGAPKIVTEGWDRSVTSFAISPDSQTVYLLAEEAGHEKPFAVAAAGGPVRPLFRVTSGCYTRLAIPPKASQTLLLANWESAISPPEIVRIELSGGHSALTEFNRERAAQLDWQPLRAFWFTSRKGKQIHNWIALPPAFDESKKYPLLVLMHGGPHSMWRDQFFLRWNYHLLAAPGYVVLMTNYTGSTGFGEQFAQAIQGDPFRGPAEEINQAADEAIRRFPFIDGTRQAAAGASYGGHLAHWMQATTTRYRCLVSHAGLINLESQWGTSDMVYHREVSAGGPPWEGSKVWREQNPIRYAKNFRTPMLLTIGERDYRVPLNQTLEAWTVLQRLRIPSRLIVFEEANHWITRAEDSRLFYQELHAWLEKYLKH